MIQRIQSIFLLLAAGALGSQFTLPYLETPADNPARAVAALSDGALTPLDNPGLLGLTVLGMVVSFVAIFLFKNRPLQAKLAGTAMIISILLMALVVFATKMTIDQAPEGSSANFNAGIGMPLLALALNWFATRAIRKDEALVRSMDRLR